MAIKIKNLIKKSHIDPTFFLLIIWYIINGEILDFFVFFLALIIHEFGHFIVAKKLSYKLNFFKLSIVGASLNYDNSLENNDEIKIALAGPLFNLISGILVSSIWWAFPSIYSFSYKFFISSLFLGLFNLLPVFPLDGGRVVMSFLSKNFDRKKVLKILKILNILFSFLFFFLFILSCFFNYNPTLILMVVFLLGGYLSVCDEGKYERLYLFKKKIKNFSKARILYMVENTSLKEMLTKIERGKYTIFYIQFLNGRYKFISEDVAINLSLKFDINTKISDIFNI